ncbi:PucR family transcriptional regulator [Gordonia sp. NPDC003424]
MAESQVNLTRAVDVLAEAIGCPVVVEDREFRVLAYSAVAGQPSDPVRDAAILRRKSPDAWLAWIDGNEDRDLSSGELHVVRDAFPGLRPRQIKAVRSDEDVVGYIWLLEGDKGFPDHLVEEVAVFERYSGPEIARMSGAGQQDAEAQFVRHFVNGTLLPADVPAMLGVDRSWQMIASCYTTVRSGYRDNSELVRIASVSRQQYPDGRGHVVRHGVIDRSLCRLDFFHDLDEHRHMASMQRAARAVHRVADSPLYLGIGSPRPLDDVATAWEEARLTARFLQFQGVDGRLAQFDAVHPRVALRAVSGFMEESPGLFARITASLTEDPSATSLDLERSLVQYLDSDGSVARAAAALHLHPNSMRYRLERIRKLLPWNIDDPLNRLILRLATLKPEEWPAIGTPIDLRDN